jgi:3-deoxy-manno-octulosonate cytidylyltransferase (CMP-KDO synthetase)
VNDWLIVIPARLESTRLPHKPLQDLGGVPLIIRVYNNLETLRSLGARTIIATDSELVVEACEKHNAEVVLTSPDHQSGTDRCWEVARDIGKDFILNVQGDEPFVDIESLQNLCTRFKDSHWADMATLVFHVKDGQDFTNPNVVKTVISPNGRALYFSRSPIPHAREASEENTPYYQHQGIYAFKKDSLRQFIGLEVSALEKTEKLEQLRALENDLSILCVESHHQSIGIDTPEDLEQAIKILKK